MRAFIAHMKAAGYVVLTPGGGFQSDVPTWRRLLHEVWTTIAARASVHIVSLPPYRSALVQGVLLFCLTGRRLIIDQRDVALESSPRLEILLERFLLRRADALIVTTHAQHREMVRRYGRLPRPFLIRNGASDDMDANPPPLRYRIWGQSRPRVLYQGLVGGKKLAEIAARLARLGCDLDLAVFVDAWSTEEIGVIQRQWGGPGALKVHSNLDAPSLVQLMDRADVALNPIPNHMDYAFTVKTADYALRGVPQLVIGSRRSMSRRVVERCRLGHAIDSVELLDVEALRQAVARFHVRSPEKLRIFRRETHATRLIQLLQEMG